MPLRSLQVSWAGRIFSSCHSECGPPGPLGATSSQHLGLFFHLLSWLSSLFPQVQNIVNEYKAATLAIARRAQQMSEALLVRITGKRVYNDLEFEEDQKDHRDLVQKKLVTFHEDSIAIMRQTYEVFKNDGSEVQQHWFNYTVRMNRMMEDALRLNVKWSLMELSRAINGDGKTGPNPLFRVKVILQDNSPGQTPQWSTVHKLVTADLQYKYSGNTEESWLGHVIKEYQDLNALWNGNYTTIELPWSYYGCGHAIYNNALYYQRVGRNIVVKYHFETGISKVLFIENSWYYERMYLFSTSKSYFSIAAEENGLWVMYLSRPDEHIMVAEVEEETFSALRHINTTYPQSKAGNAFVAGGVLYITDKNHMHVAFAFDLFREKPLEARFELKLSLSSEGFEQKVSPASNGTLVPVLAMLSYNWLNKHLHTWEHGFLIQYPVHFLV
ncbi:PREDICTED: olfactomedin-like protein 2A [Thamnophis sirtalis]|uniref:Olfactomedin-like protein 2A n=1 Tax=Thamnophis sirtalis TaxID=35019 RepID=A0A6I9YUS2_9SAUR|nr:PREDICTED: olfactomedin-like protein 2A [Thamnophis sirtalis]